MVLKWVEMRGIKFQTVYLAFTERLVPANGKLPYIPNPNNLKIANET